MFERVLKDLQASASPLAGVFSTFATRRLHFNNYLLTCIYQIYALLRFIGVKGPGTRLGTIPPPDTMMTAPLVSQDEVHPIDIGNEEENEEVQGNLSRIVDYFGELAVRT